MLIVLSIPAFMSADVNSESSLREKLFQVTHYFSDSVRAIKGLIYYIAKVVNDIVELDRLLLFPYLLKYFFDLTIAIGGYFFNRFILHP